MTSYYCRKCGKRTFINNRLLLIKCKSCKKLICPACNVNNRCIDCYVKYEQKEIKKLNSMKILEDLEDLHAK